MSARGGEVSPRKGGRGGKGGVAAPREMTSAGTSQRRGRAPWRTWRMPFSSTSASTTRSAARAGASNGRRSRRRRPARRRSSAFWQHT
eukprot:1056054-Prymnesium_polylepis.1